jgi:hypothetical protein
VEGMTRRKKNPASRSKAGFEGAIRTSNVFDLILVVTGNQRAAQDRCAVGGRLRAHGGLVGGDSGARPLSASWQVGRSRLRVVKK